MSALLIPLWTVVTAQCVGVEEQRENVPSRLILTHVSPLDRRWMLWESSLASTLASLCEGDLNWPWILVCSVPVTVLRLTQKPMWTLKLLSFKNASHSFPFYLSPLSGQPALPSGMHSNAQSSDFGGLLLDFWGAEGFLHCSFCLAQPCQLLFPWLGPFPSGLSFVLFSLKGFLWWSDHHTSCKFLPEHHAYHN